MNENSNSNILCKDENLKVLNDKRNSLDNSDEKIKSNFKMKAISYNFLFFESYIRSI